MWKLQNKSTSEHISTQETEEILSSERCKEAELLWKRGWAGPDEGRVRAHSKLP